MKKLKSVGTILVAGALAVSCMAMTAAATEVPHTSEDSVVKIGEVIAPRARTDTYNISLDPGDSYVALEEKEVEYSKGETLTFEGTWTPSYENVWVRVRNTGNGHIYTDVISSGEKSTMTIAENGMWVIEVKASLLAEHHIEGTLNVTSD